MVLTTVNREIIHRKHQQNDAISAFDSSTLCVCVCCVCVCVVCVCVVCVCCAGSPSRRPSSSTRIALQPSATCLCSNRPAARVLEHKLFFPCFFDKIGRYSAVTRERFEMSEEREQSATGKAKWESTMKKMLSLNGSKKSTSSRLFVAQSKSKSSALFVRG
jgi:hypothetical protein